MENALSEPALPRRETYPPPKRTSALVKYATAHRSAYAQCLNDLANRLEREVDPQGRWEQYDSDPFSFFPNPGPQTTFLNSKADIAIYGGAAGGGKSHALLLSAVSQAHLAGYHGVVFRRNFTQLKMPGGLWELSTNVIGEYGGVPTYDLAWKFNGGRSSIKFAHLDREETKLNWGGAQLGFVGFDELQLFTEGQFWFMLSRLRAVRTDIHPIMRASCNPDPDSFIAKLIEWWINWDTGFAIPERSGVIRWLCRRGDETWWFDTREQAIEKFPGRNPLAVTFVPSRLEDNPYTNMNDPFYAERLEAMPQVERERLRYGNWLIRAAAGNIFHRKWFPIVKAVPAPAPGEAVQSIRYWDKSDGEKGDRSAGTKMLKVGQRFYVVDVCAFNARALDRERAIHNIATQDGTNTIIWIEQEPGSGGKESAQSTVRNLAGYNVRLDKPTTNKVERWMPASAQAEAGNIFLLQGDWNEDFLREVHNSDGSERVHDDITDSFSGAFNKLTATLTRSFM